MSPDRWILSSVQPQHIYSHLLVFTLVPWVPFSLLVGDLVSINDIHQWPVIKRWTTMFSLNTSTHIVGHVLIAVFVEDFSDWWHFIYSTSLIMPVFMRFQILWLDSNVCQISSSFMEILVLCISSSWRFWSIIYCMWWLPHMSQFLYHAYSWPLYSYVSGTAICICSHMQRLIIVLYWWMASSSTWFFITPLLGWIYNVFRP